MKKKINPIAIQVLWIFLSAILSMFLLVFVTEMVVPLVLNILDMFLIQLRTYVLLTNQTTKFFAGFIFLFIYWKVFEYSIRVIWIIGDGINKCWRKADLK